MAFEEDFSPRVVGDVGGPLLCRCINGLGNPYDITGVNTANCKLRIKPENGVARDGLGSWSVVDASDGQIAYAWNAADVASSGIVRVQAAIPIDGQLRHFSVKEILFEEPL